MTTNRDIIIYQGQSFALSLDYAGTPGRGQRMHIRLADSTATVVQILTHNGATNARVLFDGTDALDMTIGGSVSAAWVVGANRVEWVYDIEDYDLSDVDDVVIPYRGKVIVYGNRTRESDVTPSDQMPSGDGRYVRFDGVQGLSAGQQLQARENIGVTGGGGGGSGDVVGPASATDDRIAAFDGVTGKLIKQSSYTIASLIAYVVTRAQHTGTQLAATISDFASAAVAAVTWSTLTGKPGTFDPSAHKTSHATGGGDALTASDIGAATAGHDHAGVYQPLATVLTNTTAAFTTAQESKLSGIEAAADVTDAGNVGTAIDGATAKTTPVDADTVPLIDSAAANVLKKLSWANIKATAKAYFDTLYQAILVSGTNIKTVNSTSLLGSGDIAISASPGGSTTQLQYNNAGAFGGMSGTAWDATNRSLVVTGATVTTSNPILNLSQTWNAGAVTFTAFKVNVTNTASAAASLLQDWQVGGVSKFSVSSGGYVIAAGTITAASSSSATSPSFVGAGNVTFGTNSGGKLYLSANGNHIAALDATAGLMLSRGWGFGWANNATLTSATGYDVALYRDDAADALAQARGTNAQTFRVYGTYTDASNYVRASLAATSTTVTLAAQTAGTGADNVPVVITPAGTSQIEVGNGVQFTEMTAPSAPAANKVILYAQDNGAGKTQLMALFASGASQQVAIEP